MLGIVSASEIARREADKVLIGVFLATGHDHSAVEWLQKSWEEMHRRSGDYWHLLVPLRRAFQPGLPLDADFALGDEIREMYGIERSQAPCIVLDDFNEEARQLFVPFPAAEHSRKALMDKMCDFIKAAAMERPEDISIDVWRRQLAGDLFARIQRDAALKAALKLAPKAFSYISKKVLGPADHDGS